jgi:hypothetical protein
MQSTSLANLAPLRSGGSFNFAVPEKFQFIEHDPSVVARAFYQGRTDMWKGLADGALSAMGSVTGAMKSARAEKLADAKSQTEHERAKELAGIRFGDNQQYDSLKNQLTQTKIDEIQRRMDDSLPKEARPQGYWNTRGNDIPSGEKILTEDIAAEFLAEAGGDVEKAKELARQAGYY